MANMAKTTNLSNYPITDCKVTARIDRDLYNYVQEHFHHGQQTNLFRQIFLSLKDLIDDGKFDEVISYMYKQKPLTLPTVLEVEKP